MRDKRSNVEYSNYPETIVKITTEIDDRYRQVIEIVQEKVQVSGTNVSIKLLQIQMVDKTINLPVCTQKMDIEDLDEHLRFLSQLNMQMKRK